MNIRKVTSKSQLNACRKLLAQDPIANVLPLGDLYSPLFQVSDIYVALNGNHAVGVCAVYHAFSTPSIVFGTAKPEVKQALLKTAIGNVPNGFISLCNPHEAELLKEYATIVHSHFEQQMITYSPRHIKCEKAKVAKIKKTELKILNDFYIEHNAEAWTPIQFKAGPYYCIKIKDKIVSAAGVHLVTPQIAQLGNIITDEAYRNQGFATTCTSLLAEDLASKGRIISLFVRTDNASAIRIYEKIGFSKKRDIAFLVLRKNQYPNT